MLKKITTNIRFFCVAILFIGMSGLVNAQTQTIAISPIQPQNTNTAFLLEVLFQYNALSCQGSIVSVYLPGSFDVGGAYVDGTVGLQPELISSVFESGTGKWKLSFSFKNITGTGNANLQINGIRTPTFGCGQQSHLISAQIDRCSQTEQATDITVLVKAQEELVSINSFSSNATDFCAKSTPFVCTFLVYIVRNSDGDTTDIQFNYNTASLKCIGLTIRNAVYNQDYNAKNIPFTDANNSVSASTILPKNLWYNGGEYYYFDVYFDVQSCSPGAVINFTPTAEIASTGTCGTITKSGTSAPISLACCNDNGIVAVPDLTPRFFTFPCLGNTCKTSSFKCQINNSFRDTASNVSNDLDYDLEIPEQIDIQSIMIESNPDYPINSGINYYYQTCGGSSSWVLGGTVTPGTAIPKTSVIGVNERFKKIRFRYANPDIAAYSSSVAAFTYYLLETNCNGTVVAPSPSSYDFVSTLSTNGTLLKQRTLPLMQTDLASCAPISSIFDFFKGSSFGGGNYTRTNVNLNVDTEYEIITQFWLDGAAGTVNDVTYSYTLHPNLSFVNATPLSFSYNVSPFNNPAALVSLSTIKSNEVDLKDMVVSISGNTMTLSNIDFSGHTCGGLTKFLYVHMKVKTKPKALAGYYQNSSTAQRSYMAQWVINSFFEVQAGQEVFCSGSDPLQEVKLKRGDPINYNYVYYNKGNEYLQNITMIGVLPHINDKKVLDNSVSRNSQFNIKGPFTITAKEVDEAGTVVKTNIAMTLLYETRPTICMPEFDFAPASCVTPQSWSPSSPAATPVLIKLTTPVDYKLDPFNKLVVTVTGMMPVAVPFGLKAYNTFAVVAERPNEGKTLTEESPVTSIELVEFYNSCEEPPPPPECITSFMPIQGEKYVVSAWVHQDNKEGAVTFDGPSISLKFVGGAPAGPFAPSGIIIDGWQRIDGEFIVPSAATNVLVQLNNSNGDNADVFFDDVRISPLKASLKSFVYDPVSLRLMSELDENNYATFYEYDEEGALIRVKKETERGVKTIKESGNNTRKR